MLYSGRVDAVQPRVHRRFQPLPSQPTDELLLTTQQQDSQLANGALPAWLTNFQPRRGLSNGHLQTIVGNFLPRPPYPLRSLVVTVLVDPADNSRVLCHVDWQPEAVRSERLTVVLVHGLEGSTDSRYIQGLAARAFAAGFNVIRMNMRNCGDTEDLTPTLYNSALSGDVGAVIDHFAAEQNLCRIALIGYSMGGNLVLKLAGERGSRAPLAAVAAVCPAIDLAADYYYRAASARVVDGISVPTLIIRALDDPFIRLTTATRKALLANPSITLVETTHGGHCAYLSRDRGEDIHWAEAAVIRYLAETAGVPHAG